MKKLISARDEVHAQLIIGLLSDHGIKAVVHGGGLATARGELPYTLDTAPSVWLVNDSDESAARELLATAELPANPRHCGRCGYDLRGTTATRCPECGWPFRRTASWTCPTCGESIEGQFTACWKCESPRSESAAANS